MNRRDFLWFSVLGVAACGRDLGRGTDKWLAAFDGRGEVVLYDTHAVALYFDGGLGPKTGIVKVDYILANEPVTFDFWHGHGGKKHQFTLTPEHFADLKKLKKINILTTPVDGHSHRLFVDPVDPKWRVAGAKPVKVPSP